MSRATPYYYDFAGWLTEDASDPARTTGVAPPAAAAERVPDQPYPNWTGFAWVLIPYTEMPLPPEPQTPEPPAPAPAPRHISVGAFFDRFGALKWAILADTAPMTQALIKDCSVRKFIDLDDPQLMMGLQMLVQAGHAIDPAAVLGAPVADAELAA